MSTAPVAIRSGAAEEQRSEAADTLVRGPRRASVRLCAAGFAGYCSHSICRTPLPPLFARELGAGPAMIGFVMGASTLTDVIVKLPAGALSDVFGVDRCSSQACWSFAGLPFTHLAAPTIVVLILFRFVHGSATAIFGPVASASLSDLAPAAKRGTGYARMFQVMAAVG